jgi:outer membrane protein TolC
MKRTGFLLLMSALSVALNAQVGLSLEQCRKMALEHNQKIKIAEGQVSAADAVKKAAFTQYLPNFSVNGAYTHMNKEFQLLKNDLFLPVVPYNAIDASTGQLSQAVFTDPAIASSVFVINPSTGTVVTDASGTPVFKQYTYVPASKTKFGIDNLYVFDAGFTQPVFLGGKIKETNKIAAYTKEIAEHNLSLTQNELIYSVEEAYWRVVSLKEKVKMATEYETMLKRLVSDLEGIHSEGIITKNDLLKAKLKLSEAELMVLKAHNGMEISKMVLCQMTGVTYTAALELTDSLNSTDTNILSYMVNEDAIADRPELKILEKNADIAKSGVNIMISRYLPNIVLNAGYVFTNPNPYNGLEEEFGNDWNVGVVCNVPVFHFGEKKHTLAAARYEKEAADLKLEETRELMVLQLQQAVYQYTESTKKTEYAAQALDQSKQNLDFTKDNFGEGMLKTTDLLEAQLLWQKAYSEFIDAKTEQQMSVCNLRKVTGKY